MGEWLLIPAHSDALGNPAGAYFERAGRRVALTYSARPIADLLQALQQLESEVTRRYGPRSSARPEPARALSASTAQSGEEESDTWPARALRAMKTRSLRRTDTDHLADRHPQA